MRGKLLPFIAPLALAVLSLIAAGCNSGNNNNVPVIQCTLPTGTTVSMVYPIPGATLVPDNLGNVITASNVALPSGWQVVLLPPYGIIGGGYLTTTLPSPLPTPNVVPTPSPSASATPLVLQASSFAQTLLPGATAFQVGLNNTASSCNSYPIIGTFTSQ